MSSLVSTGSRKEACFRRSASLEVGQRDGISVEEENGQDEDEFAISEETDDDEVCTCSLL